MKRFWLFLLLIVTAQSFSRVTGASFFQTLSPNTRLENTEVGFDEIQGRDLVLSAFVSGRTHHRASVFEVRGGNAGTLAVSMGSRFPRDFEKWPLAQKKILNHVRSSLMTLTSLSPVSMGIVLAEMRRLYEENDRVLNIVVSDDFQFTGDPLENEEFSDLLAADPLLRLRYQRTLQGNGNRAAFFAQLMEGMRLEVRNAGSLNFTSQEGIPEFDQEYLARAGVVSSQGVQSFEITEETQRDKIGALIKANRIGQAEFEKMTPEEKRRSILVLTGGGDSAGLNETIAHLIKEAGERGYQMIGVLEAFHGATQDKFGDYLVRLTPEIAGEILGFPSTVLESARVKLSGKENRSKLEKALRNFEGFAGVIPTGGNDHLEVALTLSEQGVPAVAIPKSIDNDAMTEMLGYPTAWEMGQRIFWSLAGFKGATVFEIMGRGAGWLATTARKDPVNLSSLPAVLQDKIKRLRDSALILVPEEPVSIDQIVSRAREILDRTGALNIMVSEGFSISADDPRLFDLLRNNPLLAEKYFLAASKNDPKIQRQIESNPRFAELAKEYAASFEKKVLLDPHGNPKLTGASEFVVAVIEQFVRVRVSHFDVGFTLRGLTPNEEDKAMARKFARKAVTLLLSGNHGKAVTLPFGADLINAEVRVSDIADTLPQKTLTSLPPEVLSRQDLQTMGILLSESHAGQERLSLKEIASKLRKPFRLIVADLDNSLIPGTPGMVLEPETIMLYQHLRGHGVQIAVVTGRALESATERYVNQLSPQDRSGQFFFVEGGGRGFQFDSNGQLNEAQPVFFKPITHDETIIDEIMGVAEGILREEIGSPLAGEILPIKRKPQAHPVELTIGNGMYKVPAPSRRRVVERIRQVFARDPRFNGIQVLDSILAIEMTRADKGDAIRFIVQALGIDESEVLIMGDSENDDAMFRALPKATKLYLGEAPHDGLPEDVLLSPVTNSAGARLAMRYIIEAIESEKQSTSFSLTAAL